LNEFELPIIAIRDVIRTTELEMAIMDRKTANELMEASLEELLANP